MSDIASDNFDKEDLRVFMEECAELFFDSDSEGEQ
jgi:hypothetical protein